MKSIFYTFALCLFIPAHSRDNTDSQHFESIKRDLKGIFSIFNPEQQKIDNDLQKSRETKALIAGGIVVAGILGFLYLRKK